MSSLIIGGKSKEHKREASDFYPTPSECTGALLEFLKANNIISEGSIVLEPACGDGAISEVLKKYRFTPISSDLRHTGYGMGGVDYLNTDPIRCDAIITNPPFNLAKSFIKKATAECDVVAMFLKSQYWHAANRYSLFQKRKPAYVLPVTWRPNFSPVRGSAPLMDMIWTVWVEGDNETKYAPLLKPDVSKQSKLF